MSAAKQTPTTEDALKEALRNLVEACDQMVEDTAPMFAEMQIVRGRGPYTGRQIGKELEAARSLLANKEQG